MHLRGRVSSEMTRQTAESYAKAAFASAAVRTTARVDDTLPGGWPVRVLAAIEARAPLPPPMAHAEHTHEGGAGGGGKENQD